MRTKHLRKGGRIIVTAAIAFICGCAALPALAADAGGILAGVKCANPGVTVQCDPAQPDQASCAAIQKAKYVAAPNCTPCDLVRVGVNITNLIVQISGVIALVMMVLAGLLRITAYGDSGRIGLSKKMISSTIIGIIIILSGYSIVNILFTIIGGSSDMGGFQTTYQAITGKSDWGICNDTKLPNQTAK